MKVDLDDEKAAIGLAKKQQEKDDNTFFEFIEEISYMRNLYKNQRYTHAEKVRDKLKDKLDDIMRLG